MSGTGQPKSKESQVVWKFVDAYRQTRWLDKIAWPTYVGLIALHLYPRELVAIVADYLCMATIRQAEAIALLAVPFTYILNDPEFYGAEEILFRIPFSPRRNSVIVKGFPLNIGAIFYAFKGTNGHDAWHMIGRLNSGVFFYFYAKADYDAGFGLKYASDMRLYADDNFYLLHDYCLERTSTGDNFAQYQVDLLAGRIPLFACKTFSG